MKVKWAAEGLSRGQTQSDGKIWRCVLGGLHIVVHRYHGCGDLWFGSCTQLDISQMRLASVDLEDAKREFIKKMHDMLASYAKLTADVVW